MTGRGQIQLVGLFKRYSDGTVAVDGVNLTVEDGNYCCLLRPDEPLSALDGFLRLQMRGELRQMQMQLGITFIHVPHTQLEAVAVADQVVVMEKGRIEQSSSARGIYAEPRSAYVARFMG